MDDGLETDTGLAVGGGGVDGSGSRPAVIFAEESLA